MISTAPFPINEVAAKIFDPIWHLRVFVFFFAYQITFSVESTFDALLLGILIPVMACAWVFALHKGVFFLPPSLLSLDYICCSLIN